MAVQILKAMTSSCLIAADIDDAKLEHARHLGVDHTVNTRDADAAADAIWKIAGPRGVTVALDIVGAQATVDLCVRVVGRNSKLIVVGLAGGVVKYASNSPPWGCEVSIPYWGSRTELMEVIALASAGRIKADIERYPLEQAPEVYQRLREGKIKGRAVLQP
jgi:propanol-preferring alcohol dehydrogenase